MKKNTINVLFLSIIIIGCSQSLYLPASADAAQQEKLLNGRKLYVARCSGCHNLHFPKEYTAEQWKSNLDEMQVKAKISDEQKQLILEYLTSQP
jgi:mono/diheme cytochrome c family protein